MRERKRYTREEGNKGRGMRIDQENFRVHGTSVYGCSALSLRKQHHNYRGGVSNQEEGGIGEKGENRKKILKKKKKKVKKKKKKKKKKKNSYKSRGATAF